MPKAKPASPQKPFRKRAPRVPLKVVRKGPKRHYTVEELSPLIDILVAAVLREIEDEASGSRRRERSRTENN